MNDEIIQHIEAIRDLINLTKPPEAKDEYTCLDCYWGNGWKCNAPRYFTGMKLRTCTQFIPKECVKE